MTYRSLTGLKGAALVAVATLVAACGDDTPHSTLSFYFPDNTVAYFEYGQTQQLAVRERDVARYDIVTPAGWSAEMVSGPAMRITAPAQGVPGAVYADTMRVTVYSKRNNQITVRLPVAVIEARLLGPQPANSYLVREPGTRYKLPVVRGNTSEALTATSATLVWQTDKSLVEAVTLVDGYLYFYTPKDETLHEGNAVVAALDASGDIVWSWHLWLCDFDPEQTAVAYPDGRLYMDRNVGALTADPSSEEAVTRSFGLYYQWGRKDPFTGPKSWMSSNAASTYNQSNIFLSVKYEASDSEKGTLDYAVRNPFVYITGVEESAYDWLYAARDNTLWSARKGIYDPCPPGWRVPDADAWQGLTLPASEEDFYAGWTLPLAEGTTYFPAAGRRSFWKGTLTNVNPDGSHWTGYYWSCGTSADRGTGLFFNAGAFDPHFAAERANAYPVRCVRDR